MCLFSIEIQTAGRIGTKFGTEVVLEGGKVLGGGVRRNYVEGKWLLLMSCN